MTESHLTQLLLRGHALLNQFGTHRLQCLDMPGRCEGTAACWVSDNGTVYAGDSDARFTLMSAIKPFLLLHLLEAAGPAQVAAWVGDEPSDEPYWSLKQLRLDGGRPRNAMINSGSMLLASRVAGHTPEAKQTAFLDWLHPFCPSVRLGLHEECFTEVMEPGSDPTNLALARELEKHGHLRDAEQAYEAYFRLCCLAGSIVDVARLGHALARSPSPHRDHVLHTMSHSGLYEASAEWFAATQLPAKSGVSGVMFAVYPDGSCLAACDEWLDGGGNPALPQILLAEAKDYPGDVGAERI